MSQNRSIADNETFVTLLRMAQEDREVRRVLQTLLRQPSFQRQSMLNSMVEEMRLRQAPPDFLEAMACLRDDAVAAKAAELLAGLK